MVTKGEDRCGDNTQDGSSYLPQAGPPQAPASPATHCLTCSPEERGCPALRFPDSGKKKKFKNPLRPDLATPPPSLLLGPPAPMPEPLESPAKPLPCATQNKGMGMGGKGRKGLILAVAGLPPLMTLFFHDWQSFPFDLSCISYFL